VYNIPILPPPVHLNMASSAYGQATTKDCKANWEKIAFTGAISPLPLPPLTLPSGHYSTQCYHRIPGLNATMSSPNIQGVWSKSKRRTSPLFSPSPPLSSSLHWSGIRQMHSRGGDTSMPIHALSFALDVAGGPNAASNCRGANPSIASTSEAYKKRRGGHMDIDDDSSASSLPQSKKKTARKKSATKHRCSSSIAQTSASKKKRSQCLSSIDKDEEYLDSDDDSSASWLLQSNRKKSARKRLGAGPSIASSSASKKKRSG
jgi:hypothetical protein